jgi:ribonuclease P protein component
MKQRFPPTARVLHGADYKRCFTTGVHYGSRYFRLHYLRLPLPVEPAASIPSKADDLVAAAPRRPTRLPPIPEPRLGLAVSRKFERRAVGRNRIKRLARQCFRLLRSSLQPGDYVIVPRREAAAAANAELDRDLGRLLQRAGALKAADAQGTMPVLSDSSAMGAVAADQTTAG